MKAGGATIREYDVSNMKAASREAAGKLETEGLWRAGLFDAVKEQ